MFTRRSFVAASAALPLALRALAESKTVIMPKWIFLGTDKGKGIFRATWNTATGEIGRPELAIESSRPDFFALHPERPVLYTVNSVGNGKGAVSAYRIDRTTGALTLLNQVSSHGDGPCAISITTQPGRAYVANYSGGSFASYSLDAQGRLLDSIGSFDCSRHKDFCGPLGPVKDHQDAAHLHCATIAPSGHIIVCDLGNDAVHVYASPRETLLEPQRFAARKGSGPRHVAFHPNGKWMYCIHELDCTIDLYDWSAHGSKASLTLREASVISTLAPNAPLTGNTACEIVVGDNGRFVYACTRGVDEITVYRVDARTGLLTEQQRLSSGGKIPRMLAFDPSHRWLVSCTQSAPGSLAVFAHDPATGRLSAPASIAADTPMCCVWV